jgi:hypothetical protein
MAEYLLVLPSLLAEPALTRTVPSTNSATERDVTMTSGSGGTI